MNRGRNSGMIGWRPIRAIGIACLAALSCAAPGTAAPTGQLISNTATIQWDSAGGPATRNSNRIDTAVVTSDDPLTFWRPTSGVVPADLLAQSCGSTADAPSQSLAGLPSSSTTELAAGRGLILTLELPSANTDTNAVDTIELEVRTGAGDRETLRFTETAANSGIFKAAVLTRAAPNPLTANDCRLNIASTGQILVSVSTAGGAAIASGTLRILADSNALAFDSRSGTPVSGVRITLVDATTGQPVPVFGDDGLSTFPSSIVTGQTVTDSGGSIYAFGAGEYRFPFIAPGNYRLTVESVQPFSAPSAVTPSQLADLVRPDGGSFTITDGSYGNAFLVAASGAIRLDIPLDQPAGAVTLTKTASRGEASVGDLIQYAVTLKNGAVDATTGGITVRDQLPPQLRFRPGSARLNRQKIADPVSTDGQDLVFTIPTLAAGAAARLTYLTEVRPDARSGTAVNRVTASSAAGTSNTADAAVRILRDDIADRITIGGRIVLGDCAANGASKPVANVRILLEDGSYALSDIEGRFHFEGVTTGSHVVAIDRSTIPAGLEPVDCAKDARSGGNPASRLVDGLGGQFKTLTFHLTGTPQEADTAAAHRPQVDSDAVASGAQRDWLKDQAPGIDWLFPAVDYNPRAPVLRVAIKHRPGQKVELFIDDRPVDATAFDGTIKNAAGIAVSQWRGIPLGPHTTSLRAIVRDGNGAVAETLVRKVVFANSAVKASLVAGQSLLVADGVHRPVIAVRLTNRDGRPVRHGLVGDFGLSEPYFAAIEASAQQVRQLSGLERAAPSWRVDGDAGIAYIELEPTTVSGTAVLTFKFRDGERVREQRLEVWLNPGDRPWTVVGLAEGSIGFNRIDRKMERLGSKDSTDGRLALYAKGRIKGEWLMTLAYDSDKKRGDNRLGGTIDPNAYYTVYADRSERRYDAASVRKLYLKLERPQFAALFGDYVTAIDEPQLARYVRSFNGVKAEYRSKRVSAIAFGADEAQSHRREEIQGNGLSGPYPLGARDILANSERITLEIRDRFRSERIVEQRILTRYTDYEIDYAAGTLRFRGPILSRDPSLNPQFIVADYEVDGTGQRKLNAGARVAWRRADERLQVGATAIHDANSSQTSNLGGIDVRFRPDAATEVRAEAALSRTDIDGEGKGDVRKAWLVEVERHDGALDLLAYARSRDSGFGLGQTNASENGTLKIGADASLRVGEHLTVTGSAWRDDYLNSDARRVAGRGLLEYRRGPFSARAGFVFAADRLADGTDKKSTLVELGATSHFLSNRLELDASSQIPLGGQDGSVDFPARHRLTGRYAVTRDVALVASYEIASGDAVKARTARLGFDIAPWAGARLSLAGSLQDVGELGTRSFAAFGLSQSVTVGKHWTIDGSLDGNRTLGGINPTSVLNPLHPVASGGFVGDGSLLTEDFVAATFGVTYRADLWTITGRGEVRNGDKENRTGLILGAIRQIGEGQTVGGSLDWYRADSKSGAQSEVASARLSWAYRPGDSAFAFLDKLEFRSDRVTGAVVGEPGPLGSVFSIDGDAKTIRLINNFSASLHRLDDRAELNLFWGARYASDRFGPDDVKGLSNLLALEGRLSVRSSMELGFAGTARHSLGGQAIAWSFGPQVGFAPVKGSLMTVGYNFAGYRDRDFEDDRYTRSGAYATVRLKFDELSLGALGLGRSSR